jgi:hypothetical protein
MTSFLVHVICTNDLRPRAHTKRDDAETTKADVRAGHDDPNVRYYLTVYNEPIVQPPEAGGCRFRGLGAQASQRHRGKRLSTRMYHRSPLCVLAYESRVRTTSVNGSRKRISCRLWLQAMIARFADQKTS